MRENRLKRLLAEGQPAYGVWLGSGSVAVAEAVGHLEADWVLLDAEHGVASYESAFSLLQAMAASPATSVVRVPACEATAVRRVLDMGAEGVLVPFVRTAEEVASVVSASRYPPEGNRGIGPYRASRYYLEFSDYFEAANREVLVLVQIETREALDNLDSILAVEGLDGVFIGPADLAAALGCFPDIRAPMVESAVEDIVTAGRAAGLPVGFYCDSGKEACRRVEEGCQMVNVGIDLTALLRSLKAELEEARRPERAPCEARRPERAPCEARPFDGVPLFFALRDLR